MHDPDIAVVMACHNGLPYLSDAVESIRGQTFDRFELIVVDDGSTDGSGDYLRSVADADPRVRVITQVQSGQQAAANRGIAAAKAPLIARMDADDVSSPDRLAKQVEYMDRHPEVGLAGSQIRRLGSRGGGLTSSFPLDHRRIVAELMQNRHAMCNPSVVFRKSLFDQIGGYWDHNIAEDWDMFLRMADVSKLANLPNVLLDYRFHTGSINGRRIVEAQFFNEYAADRARRRQDGQPDLSVDEFRQTHRSNHFPGNWTFYMDAQSIGQYREAIADIYGGHPVRGYARLMLSASMSPQRTTRRIARLLRRVISPKPSIESSD